MALSFTAAVKLLLRKTKKMKTDALNKMMTLVLLEAVMMLFCGCAPSHLIYIYDTENNRSIGVTHYESNKPGLWVGNIEDMSYCNSKDPFFITTQIFDRENVGFIIKKRDYSGKIIASNIVSLGKEIDYTGDAKHGGGGFCVNRNMSKGAVLQKLDSRIVEAHIAATDDERKKMGDSPRNLDVVDFKNKIKKVITTIEGDCDFTWIDADHLLLCEYIYKDNQKLSIIDTADIDNVKYEIIFTEYVAYHLSADREKIYYSYRQDKMDVLRCYMIKEKIHQERNVALTDGMERKEYLPRFRYEDHIYFLFNQKIGIFDLNAPSKTHTVDGIGSLKDLRWQSGIASADGLMLSYFQDSTDWRGRSELKRKYYFIHNRRSPDLREVKIGRHDLGNMHTGYMGRYIIISP